MATKTISPEVAGKATEVVGQLDELVQLNQQIENARKAELTRTNQSLYEVLGRLYAYFLEVSSDEELLSAVLSEMAKALEGQGHRVQKKKPLNTFVRYVFGTDRQRTYNYKRCLQAAIDGKVPSGGFKVFIMRNGGIEACKAKSKPQTIGSKQVKVADAYEYVEKSIAPNPLARISLAPEVVLEAMGHKYTVLLAKTSATGQTDILAVVPKNNQLIDSCLVQLKPNMPKQSDPQQTVESSSVGLDVADLIKQAAIQAVIKPVEKIS